MTKWEYLVVFSDNDGIVDALGLDEKSHQTLKGKPINEAFDILGQNGWELVTSNNTHSDGRVVAGVFFVFKKPLG